ncbi:MAG: flotillin family protein [Thermoguttaceae bacterium]|nr:flotillin family protein [Thermoguttaceae bacterium]MBR4752062.1 flotillin family protein [Thermoguttaceae bacterium]
MTFTTLISAPVFGATGAIAAAAIIAALLFFGTLLLFSARYKRCPSNKIMVIFGRSASKSSALCIHGGAKFIVPLFQDYAFLSLEPMQIEIPLRGALSMENIRVNVPSVFSIAIGTTPELMQNAAIRLLGMPKQAIAKQAEDVIFGQLRQVIASMKIDEINRDREAFLSNIQASLEPELKKLGLILINVNVTDITDESGYIEAIGRKAASEAIQKARGDVADNERMGETRVADAEKEKAIQVANAKKDQAIGTREADREQIVKTAEIEQEQAVRLADLERIKLVGQQSASFEKDAQIKDAERDMRVKLANANAEAVKGENLAQAVVVNSTAELAVKKAEAFQMSETKKRQAEASVAEAEHKAQAVAATARAERVEAERRAELEAPAKAEKARIIVEAEAAAEQKRIEAEGEAAAIYAKLEAEARGQFEILKKKGEGLAAIVQACGGAKEAFQMLMLDHFDELVAASAQAISSIKFDKVIVWDGANGGANAETATSNWLRNMAKTLPPMLEVMKEIGGVEFPDVFAKLASAEEAAKNAPVVDAEGAVEPEDGGTIEPENKEA